MKFRGDTSGFALPTVVISSLILMIVLVAGLSVANSTRISLQTQYYDQLIREAAEAGTTFAQACLEANNYTPQWTNAKPLTPSTDCSGNIVGGCASGCYVYSDAKIQLSFQVNLPSTTADGFQAIQATGSLSQLRASNGAVWNTTSQTINAKAGASVSAQTIVFGDSQYAPMGSFYGVIGGDGSFKTAGLNTYGQLGQGVAAGTTVTVPGKFLTPGSTAPIIKGFANNVSIGTALFAVNSDGQAYAAGNNNHGQLGVGSGYAGNVITPALVQISGKQISSIATIGDANGGIPPASYFVTTDGYMYSSGACSNLLGYSCTVDQLTPQIISGLPTPNVNDLNTLPSDNIVVDAGTAYVRMQGGRVYGWGLGSTGQLGSFARTNSATPVKIATYGDSGKPKAVNIQFDGNTLFVLDDGGNLTSVGWNKYGQMGNRTSYIYMNATNGKCITFYGGYAPQLQPCLGTADQQLRHNPDNTISNLGGCLTINPDNTWMSISQCTGAANQIFQIDQNNYKLYNPTVAKCLDNYNGDGQALWMYTCIGGNGNQYFDRYNPTPTPFNMTGISGAVTMISADQYSVSAVANGQVWSAGVNYSTMFGSALVGLSDWVPDPVKFDLSAYGSPKITYVINTVTSSAADVYAIATDGRVYGAGGNAYGQLGNCTTSTAAQTPIQMKLLVPLSASYTPCTINANAIEDLNPVQVISGAGTTVVRMATNRVFSVGNNSNGQLGDGTTTSSAEPKARLYLNPAKPQSY